MNHHADNQAQFSREKSVLTRQEQNREYFQGISPDQELYVPVQQCIIF